MTGYSKKVSESTPGREALEELAGEPLAGSGFESETPDEAINDDGVLFRNGEPVIAPAPPARAKR